MSPPNSTSALESPPPPVARSHRKPQADLYTILLVIALLAILLAILFLYLYMKTFEFKTSGGPPVAMAGNPLSLAASTLFSGF